MLATDRAHKGLRKLAGLALLAAGALPGLALVPRSEAQPPPRGEVRTVRGTVERLTTAPRGEVDGAVLDDGRWVHWPPHLGDRFSGLVRKGDRIRATGRTETGPKGDTKFEVESLTNLDSGRSVDLGDGPVMPRAKGKGRGRPGPAAQEERMRQLEDQVEQLRREIARLRRKD